MMKLKLILVPYFKDNDCPFLVGKCTFIVPVPIIVKIT